MSYHNPRKAALHNYNLKETYVLEFQFDYHPYIQPGNYTVNLAGTFCLKHNLPFFAGYMSGSIELICQISLDLFSYRVDHDLTLYLVNKREIKMLEEKLATDRHLEYYCYDQTLDMTDVLVEDILLQLPLMPKKPILFKIS